MNGLSDNGSPYTAGETRALARDIGLKPCTTPIQSPQSNGMAEAFVKTIKRDLCAGQAKPDAASVLRRFDSWFEHYNTVHPHKRLATARPASLGHTSWRRRPRTRSWDGQMLFLVQHGFRCIAHDRRGHGRSSQASEHNDMNGYADDLAALLEALDLKAATLVGHSTGGGEVARYIGRHGTKRVKKAVLVAAVQ